MIRKYYNDYNVKVIAYCIMSSHAHFIYYVDNTNEISNMMRKINTLYAKYYNQKYERVGYVFRDRFKSQYIYSRDYLLKCIKYIHMNPVKAQIVNSEKQYKFSSYEEFREKINGKEKKSEEKTEY